MHTTALFTFTLLAVLSTGAAGVPITENTASIAQRDPQLLGGLLSVLQPSTGAGGGDPGTDDDDDDGATPQPEARWLAEDEEARTNAPAERRQGREDVANVGAAVAVPPTFAGPGAQAGASGRAGFVPGHGLSIDTAQHGNIGSRQVLGILSNLLGPGQAPGGGASD